MKTPTQVIAYLDSKTDKEAAKAVKERERYLKRLGKELSDILDGAVRNGNVNAEGGRILYSNFDCLDPKNKLSDVQEIFRNSGWNCQYSPMTEDSYSMTCKGASSFTFHYFYLSPLNNEVPSSASETAPPSERELRARKRFCRSLDKRVEQAGKSQSGGKEDRQRALEKRPRPYQTPVTAENNYKTVD